MIEKCQTSSSHVHLLRTVHSTNTARTELHCMITYHHANTRVSRAERLRITHLCVLKLVSSTCHVTFLAAPDTDHMHKFSLPYLTYLSDNLTNTHKTFGTRPQLTLRSSTAVADQHKSHLSHIYNGEATSFHEWEFRTRLRIAGKTGDQYIEAMSKVCDGLRGDAFVAAQEVGFDNLCETIDGRPCGIDTLINHMRGDDVVGHFWFRWTQ